MDKAKIVQIYEAMADMTLEMINREKNSFCLGENELKMVRITQSLYETINYANRPVITPASMFDVLSE